MELDWSKFTAIASRFQYKARAQDREDLNHSIILRLAEVAQKNGHKPLTDGAMIRIASYTVADYWRTQYKLTNGLDCGSCGKAQREKCRKDNLYSECPKAITVEYLSKPIVDSDGNITELGQMLADDKAIDLEAWVDAKAWLLGCPKRLVGIAHKRVNGIALTEAEDKYLDRFRKKERKQMSLF